MFKWNCRAESFGITVVIIVPTCHFMMAFHKKIICYNFDLPETISRSILQVQQTLLAYVPFNKKKQLTVLFSPFFCLMNMLLLPAKGVPCWSMQPQTICPRSIE
jgi:hypothetical protein